MLTFNTHLKSSPQFIILIGEILALAGCDLLTISPGLLEKLDNMQDPVPKVLSTETAQVNTFMQIVC
jgi:transaldolase